MSKSKSSSRLISAALHAALALDAAALMVSAPNVLAATADEPAGAAAAANQQQPPPQLAQAQQQAGQPKTAAQPPAPAASASQPNQPQQLGEQPTAASAAPALLAQAQPREAPQQTGQPRPNQPQAQQVGPQPTAAQPEPARVEEVTVTGTLIKRTTDYSTPTPTTVIDSELLNNIGAVNVGQALQVVPANIPQYTPATTGDSPFFIGAVIPDLRGLNPEFGSRTLTLINGERVVPTNSAGSFDLTLVPQILFQRTDVVTGGASATYGSGAEAGVVNIILDDKLEGGKINADFSQSHDSDARDAHIGAAWGHGFFDERFHLVIAGEFEKQDGLGCQDARSWCGDDQALQVQGYAPTMVAPVALYGSAVVPHLTNPTISSTGVFQPAYRNGAYSIGALALPYSQLTQLLPGGGGFQSFNQGNYAPGTLPGASCPYWCLFFPGGFPATATDGQGVPSNQYNQLLTPVTHGVITVSMTGKVTDSINVKLNVNWGKTQSSQLDYPGAEEMFPVFAGINTPMLNVPGNPYLSSAQWAQLASNYAGQTNPTGAGPGTGIYEFGKDLTSQLDPSQVFTTTLRRLALGFNGKIGSSSWTWDAYATYGESDHEQVQHGISSTAFSMATDVIQGPNGPECRVSQPNGLTAAVQQDMTAGFFPSYVTSYLSTTGTNFPSLLPTFAHGCQPINLFSSSPLSPGALSFATGTLDERTHYSQTVFSADATGNFFGGIGAGPWQVAAGMEWRREMIHNLEGNCDASDLQCQLDLLDFPGQYGNPFAGQVIVKEPFIEFNLPLAKDLPFAKLLDLDLAARQSWYDTSRIYVAGQDSPITQPPAQFVALPFEGNQSNTDLSTWKASLVWAPIEAIKLRTTYSKDQRAPDFQELFHSDAVEPGALFGGSCNVNPMTPCYNYYSGNINLQPESSKTFTMGLVLTPPQLPGLQLSGDFFHIHITNPIYQNTDETPVVSSACMNNTSSPYCNQVQVLPNQYEFTPGSMALVPGSIASYTNSQYLYACNPAVATSVSPITQPGGALNCAGLPTLSGVQAYARGAPNVTSDIYSSFNGAWFNERGVDFSLSYATGLPDGSSLSLRSLATWTTNQTYQVYSGGPVNSLLGQLGNFSNFGTEEQAAPKWRGNVIITWVKGGLSVTPNMSWVGHGLISANALTPADGAAYQELLVGFPDATTSMPLGAHPKADTAQQSALKAHNYTALPFNSVPSYFLFGLNTAYNFQNVPNLKGLQVYLQVNNLFNKIPPLTEGGVGGANPAFYDTLGLDYRAGFRMTF